METGTRIMAQVRQATALLEAASRALAGVSAAEAIGLARTFARAEKVAMAATRSALLHAGDDAARHDGGERDIVSLAAQLCGTSKAKARKGLRSAQLLETVSAGKNALLTGSLSLDQAEVVADVARKDPSAVNELLAEAGRTSLGGLRSRAAAAAAARSGEESAQERERKLAARRFCRTVAVPGGGVRLDALLPSAEGSELVAALAGATDKVWRAARRRGVRLSVDQARADALVALCRGGTSAGGAPGGPPEIVVTVDAAALVRGEVRNGERCVIDGVGPVPVAHARGILGEALLTLCVTEGRDVRTVTSTNRVVPGRVRKALALRDQTCVVPGCGQRSHLEIDHWRLDFSRGGLTALDNLCRLCAPHHRLKTRTGWRIGGGPDRWQWSPPRGRRGAGAGRAGPEPPGSAGSGLSAPLQQREDVRHREQGDRSPIAAIGVECAGA